MGKTKAFFLEEKEPKKSYGRLDKQPRLLLIKLL